MSRDLKVRVVTTVGTEKLEFLDFQEKIPRMANEVLVVPLGAFAVLYEKLRVAGQVTTVVDALGGPLYEYTLPSLSEEDQKLYLRQKKYKMSHYGDCMVLTTELMTVANLDKNMSKIRYDAVNAMNDKIKANREVRLQSNAGVRAFGTCMVCGLSRESESGQGK